MADHLELMEKAKAAIERVFSDTSVDRATTRGSLEELICDIEEWLTAVQAKDD